MLLLRIQRGRGQIWLLPEKVGDREIRQVKEILKIIKKIIFFSKIRHVIYFTNGEMTVHQCMEDIWGEGMGRVTRVMKFQSITGPALSGHFPFLNLRKAKCICLEKIKEVWRKLKSLVSSSPSLCSVHYCDWAILPRVTELIRGKAAIWILHVQSSFDDSAIKYFNILYSFFIAVF